MYSWIASSRSKVKDLPLNDRETVGLPRIKRQTLSSRWGMIVCERLFVFMA
jgi:hypothetical protein